MPKRYSRTLSLHRHLSDLPALAVIQLNQARHRILIQNHVDILHGRIGSDGDVLAEVVVIGHRSGVIERGECRGGVGTAHGVAIPINRFHPDIVCRVGYQTVKEDRM